MKQVKIEIKWTIIFSITLLIWMFLEKISGLHSQYIAYHLYLTNLYLIPHLIIFILALREKKKKYYYNRISYLKGLISGTILSLLITIISPALQWIISYIITPNYFSNIIEYALKTGNYKTLAEAETFFNFKSYVIQGAIGNFILGIVFTLFIMLFLKYKRN